MTALVAGGPAAAKTYQTRESITIPSTAAQQSISVRPFAKISATTDTGVYMHYAHGATSRI